ncbi:hypothetical protein C2845_PM18G08030 [Panicum miliaceum]|uniref:Uncharacterized protein n=1 Tax=Panicum miliaceum TaxID=4540 RepID=A0A3L6PJC2_PANMI|nr:hypothetical protein C2845_PM18G08030 [Panicum miliaceum]
MGSAHSSHSSVSTAGGEDDDEEEPSAAAAPSSAGPPAPRRPALEPAPVRVPPAASASKVLEQEPEELDFPEEQIQLSDSLAEMSQGQWEGCPKSEIYTPEMVNLMESSQPDFSAPSGESLRQVCWIAIL